MLDCMFSAKTRKTKKNKKKNQYDRAGFYHRFKKKFILFKSFKICYFTSTTPKAQKPEF